MTVKEIIEKWLRENGYSGLYNEDECGCSIDDFIPCGESCNECKPGYKVSYGDDSYDFVIQPKKPVVISQVGECLIRG